MTRSVRRGEPADDELVEAQVPISAGQRNWTATVDDAQLVGALWFERATHAMRDEAEAAVEEFTDLIRTALHQP